MVRIARNRRALLGLIVPIVAYIPIFGLDAPAVPAPRPNAEPIDESKIVGVWEHRIRDDFPVRHVLEFGDTGHGCAIVERDDGTRVLMSRFRYAIRGNTLTRNDRAPWSAQEVTTECSIQVLTGDRLTIKSNDSVDEYRRKK